MNAVFHQLCVQPEGAERRELLAMRAMLDEGIRDMRSHVASQLRRIRRDTQSLRKAEAKRAEINRKLRGEA